MALLMAMQMESALSAQMKNFNKSIFLMENQRNWPNLAPDDETNDIYTLGAIYKEGRTVTVRCHMILASFLMSN